MRVRAITNYNDFCLKRAVVKGEELEVADARAKILTEAKKAVLIDTATTEKVVKGRGRKKEV